MPTAHLYIRVSTKDQSLSPEWQERICRNYYDASLAPRGYELGGIYSDIGQSAFSIPWAEREAGRQLFQAIKPGDVIVVAKQCRAWRTVRDRENCLFLFRQLGIDIAILDSNIDTSTAAGRFAAGVLQLQVSWESDVRSERMKAAHVVRRRRKTPGRRHPPPGWKYDHSRGELVPDLRERKLLDLIYKWRATRVRSIKSTCRWLKEEGIQRDSGASYNVQWVQRAWLARQRNWPQEGYVQRFWRDPSVPAAQKDKYRLPKVEGKKHVNFHPRRVREADANDIRWITATFGKDRTPSAHRSSNT